MASSAKYNDLAAFKSLLSKHGLRQTSQRLAVHRAMMRLIHASADIVCAEIQKEGMASVTAASVYNILNGLSEKGIYAKRMCSSGKLYFDIRPEPHAHYYDTKNDVLIDVTDEKLQQRADSLLARRRITGYHLDSVDIYILCHPTGRKKKVQKA